MKKVMNTFWASSIILLSSCGQNAKQDGSTVSQAQNGTEVVQVSNESDASEQNLNSVTEKAKIEVLEDSFDFGTIKEGEKVEKTFTLKNIGGSPLIISGASASCGCTTPEFTSQPIPPGHSTTIKTTFDSNGQVGQQHKMIIVSSNADNGMVQLHLRGEVKPKK